MKAALALITIGSLTLLLGSPGALALDPSLDVSQYGHTAWTARDGFSSARSLRWPKRPMGISGWARNTGCFASMLFPGNHLWSEVDSGTEVELIIHTSKAYSKSARRFWSFSRFSKKCTDVTERIES